MQWPRPEISQAFEQPKMMNFSSRQKTLTEDLGNQAPELRIQRIKRKDVDIDAGIQQNSHIAREKSVDGAGKSIREDGYSQPQILLSMAI